MAHLKENLCLNALAGRCGKDDIIKEKAAAPAPVRRAPSLFGRHDRGVVVRTCSSDHPGQAFSQASSRVQSQRACCWTPRNYPEVPIRDSAAIGQRFVNATISTSPGSTTPGSRDSFVAATPGSRDSQCTISTQCTNQSRRFSPRQLADVEVVGKSKTAKRDANPKTEPADCTKRSGCSTPYARRRAAAEGGAKALYEDYEFREREKTRKKEERNKEEAEAIRRKAQISCKIVPFNENAFNDWYNGSIQRYQQALDARGQRQQSAGYRHRLMTRSSPRVELYQIVASAGGVGSGDVKTEVTTQSPPTSEATARLPAHIRSGSCPVLRSYTDLHYWAAEGELEIAKSLVAHRSDVNATTADFSTPLMMAVEEGHLPIAKFIMDNGARKVAKDENGFAAQDRCENAMKAEFEKLLASP